MFRCVVAFLLINTFYCSFGYPLKINETLGRSLQILADSCQNDFLSIQIKNHIETCDITLSAEREIKGTELECLIFYDINNQLCTALRGSKLNHSETYDSEINQAQKVSKICSEASQNWKFTNLTLYPKYYNTSQAVFKTDVICLKACGVESILSEDTNFFCKYYQWGSKLLQQLPTGDVISEDRSVDLPTVKKVPTVPNSTPNQNSPKGQSQNEHLQPVNVQEQAQLEVPKFQEPDVDNIGEQTPINASQPSNEHPKISKPGDNSDSQPPALGTHTPSSGKNNTEPSSVLNNLPIMNKPNNLNPKSELDDDDHDMLGEDEDSDTYDSGNPSVKDQQPKSNDNNDPSLGIDPKPKEEKQIQQKNVEAIVSSFDIPGSQKDVYSNTMSDQFGEVDDHFFSFFLTATILVIFFYVLYHNKSKFRKVFLGLLVEGRQPGRRRNSRGHEYRRLDTLEQAMSTNSAAPPSKIIY